MPAYIEAGAPGGYYRPGTLDGSRPGSYYINLRDTAEVPKFTLPTLTYHEGDSGPSSAGHPAALEAKEHPDAAEDYLGSRATGEGWALYSEQLRR